MKNGKRVVERIVHVLVFIPTWAVVRLARIVTLTAQEAFYHAWYE